MRLLPVAALVAATLAVPVAHAAPAGWTPRPATYGTAVDSDVVIPMSDGVRLNADVIRPAAADGTPAPGAFPVLVTQTPYNKNAPRLNFRSDYLVTRGYVQVIVDVRGTGGSEGTWRSFDTREQLDGGEVVRWAAAQPWSDGRIALHGTSYGAINQFFTAAREPGLVKAMFPIVPMSDAYRDVTVNGGAVNTSFIPTWLGLVTGTGLVPPTYTGTDPERAAAALGDHARGATEFQAGTVVSASTGGDNAFDGPFYRERSPIEIVDQVVAPAFVVGGWSDIFQRGEPLLYQRLRANGVPTRLLMGPWTHTTAGNGLPAGGVPSLDELELRWFDHFVLDRPDPGLHDDVPQVTYYRLGEERWTTATAWPPKGVTYTEFRLPGTAPDTLVPVPTAGACSRSTVQWSAGTAAGTPCDDDNRVTDAQGVTYDFPVTAPLTLAGPVSARLFVSSNARDALLTARLEDVAPDGTSTQLSAGWNVLSLRALDPARTEWDGDLAIRPYHPFTRQSALAIEADTPYEVWVEVFPTAAMVAPGHSLRLSVQAADAPHLTQPLPQAVDSAGAVLSVWHDAEHPSSVVVPVL